VTEGNLSRLELSHGETWRALEVSQRESAADPFVAEKMRTRGCGKATVAKARQIEETSIIVYFSAGSRKGKSRQEEYVRRVSRRRERGSPLGIP
jgi:hypothetical protein